MISSKEADIISQEGRNLYVRILFLQMGMVIGAVTVFLSFYLWWGLFAIICLAMILPTLILWFYRSMQLRSHYAAERKENEQFIKRMEQSEDIQ